MNESSDQPFFDAPQSPVADRPVSDATPPRAGSANNPVTVDDTSSMATNGAPVELVRVKVCFLPTKKKTKVPFDRSLDVAGNLQVLDGKKYFGAEVNGSWNLVEEDGTEIKDTEDLVDGDTYKLKPDGFQDSEEETDDRDLPEEGTRPKGQQRWKPAREKINEWMGINGGKFVEPRKSSGDPLESSILKIVTRRRQMHQNGSHNKVQSALLHSLGISGFEPAATAKRKAPPENSTAAGTKKRGRPPKLHKPTDHSNLPKLRFPGDSVVQSKRKRTVYWPKSGETIKDIARKFELKDVARVIRDNRYLGAADEATSFDPEDCAKLVLYLD